MDSLRKSYRSMVFTGVLASAPLLIYAALFEIISSKGAQLGSLGDTLGPLPYIILLGLATVSMLLAPPLRKFMISRSGLISASPMPFQKGLSRPALKVYAATYIMLGLFHTTGIVGLLLSFITGSRIFVYLGSALALALTVVHFPRYEQWEEWVRQAEEVEGSR